MPARQQHSIRSLAKKLEVSHTTVVNVCRQLGIDTKALPGKPRYLTEAEITQITAKVGNIKSKVNIQVDLPIDDDDLTEAIDGEIVETNTYFVADTTIDVSSSLATTYKTMSKVSDDETTLIEIFSMRGKQIGKKLAVVEHDAIVEGYNDTTTKLRKTLAKGKGVST